MSTLKQIEANRLNAQKSTGPRTAEGKSKSRLNALKHGLFATDPVIQDEDRANLEALHTSHHDQFRPATPHEHVLLAAMIRDAWTLERFSRLETALWDRSMENESQKPFALARSYSCITKQLAHVQRRLDSAQRNYRRNLDLLLKLRRAGPLACQPAELIPQPSSPQSLNPEIGFIPSNPDSPSPSPITHSLPSRKPLPEAPPEAT